MSKYYIFCSPKEITDDIDYGIAVLFLILSVLYLNAYWITHVFIWKQT